MLRRRRRTFLCATLLTVLGIVVAQRSDAEGRRASAADDGALRVITVGTARLSPVGDVPAFVRPTSTDVSEGSAPRHVLVVSAADRMRRCPSSAVACVDLRAKRAWLQHDGRTTFGPVVIGQGPDHHPTPRGQFNVRWKTADYTSHRYGIPMPYSVFFADAGIAFHQGAL